MERNEPMKVSELVAELWSELNYKTIAVLPEINGHSDLRMSFEVTKVYKEGGTIFLVIELKS